jgi:hypothetical protein
VAGAAAAVTPTTLGLVIGTNVQAYSAKLGTFAALADAAGWLHSSGAGVYAWSTPTAADVGALAVAGTAADSDKLDGAHGSAYSPVAGSSSIVTLGTVTTGHWHGDAVDAGYGGTGQLGGYAVGDLLYASAAATLSKLAAVAVGSVLVSQGVTTAPAWAALNQAAVAGLTTGSTVLFAGLTLGVTPGTGTGALYCGALTATGLLGVTVSSGYAATLMGGTVGIGTTSPTGGKLHVDSGSSVGVYSIGTGSNFVANANTTGIFGHFQGQRQGAKKYYLGLTAGDDFAVLNSDATAALTVMTSGDSGNVGIGTTTPLSKLSINGGLHVGGDSDAGDNNALIDGTLGCGALTATTVTITDGTSTTISTKKAATFCDGYNIWIGGGGTSVTGGDAGTTYYGSYNAAVGLYALYSNTTGYFNTALGMQALYSNTTGYQNTALGMYALFSNTTGYQNTAHGYAALFDLNITTSDGGANTAIGYAAGRGIVTGTGNTILGANVTGLAAALTNNIILANGTGAIKAQHDGTNWTLSGALTTNGGLQTFGANDSAGAGYRTVRVPNA